MQMETLNGLRRFEPFPGDPRNQHRQAMRAALKPGDLVKISRNHESFWVGVEHVEGDYVHGSVRCYRCCNDDIHPGQLFGFYKWNIFDIDPGGNCNFQSILTSGVYNVYDLVREQYPERSEESFLAALHKAVDDAVRLYDEVQKKLERR